MEVLENYIINQLEQSKLKIAELQERLDEKEKQTLGIAYRIDVYDWYVRKDNYKQYEAAYNKQNFDWLKNNGFSVETVNYNCMLQTDYQTLYLNIEIKNDNNAYATQVYPGDHMYLDKVGAQAQLLFELRKCIDKIKESIEAIPNPEEAE